jgi:glutaredoxin
MRKLTVFVAASFLLASPLAFAQYKIVGPDGKITYSDRPAPPESGQVKVSRMGEPERLPTASSSDELPFAVKQAANKYPVTLYSAPECAPCNQAKQHLSKRGVPFTEKIVRNTADIQAFKGLGFSESSFPAITVGAQKQSGFLGSALDTLLDAAGYPKTAKLPASYQAKAEPLTPDQAAKTSVRVAEAAGGTEAKSDGKSERSRREVKPSAAPAKTEPVIRF